MTIRSFVRRSGRITTAQQRALTHLWDKYSLDTERLLDLNSLFGRPAEKHLEIGFGMGETLLNMAQTHPEQDYLGIDVYLPGIGRVLMQIEKYALTNVRICCADAVKVLQQCLPDQSLDTIYIFFPDPWPKKRHQKRRLIQQPFVSSLAQSLKQEGFLYLATDWQDYAQQMLTVLEEHPLFNNYAGKGCFANRPEERPLTKFERRGQKLGHPVWDLLYQRV